MNTRRQERKVVTVLFCDLVGFTQQAEEMDPEDVASLLGPYHVRLKEELERYGGTVEKFIGDAVMAVFGAPLAHEDDPERAVRAALAIRDYAEATEIELRIGITTGEALVTLDARPDQGESMATGDVVNTAARLQAAASVNGVLVSEKTYEATKSAIEYERADSVEAKGKAKPVLVWTALGARSRVTLDRLHASPLVGRARELDQVVDALTRSRAERQPQLVTVVGVPGIGKSRLVYELFQAVDRDPDLISWRQGRCLPYGDGVTFWALGEIVKAQVGILEGDTAETADAKLQKVATDEWVRSHLRPLVGLTIDSAGEGDRREEAFTAWRRFLEGIAAERPLVLVFEDLHWADENLLDFVDHLVDWASGVPMLVVCSARPELLEHRPGWGGGKTNALAISLSPLSDEETTRLVGGLIERVALSVEAQTALLSRAGGNPLYAEQYARLLEERSADELGVPETVQGMIAARLDLLEPAQKALLQNAAVIGKTFWLGALTALSGREQRSAEVSLHGLERKGFVRREQTSSIEGDTEYAFLHILVHEVAYGQIPRAARSEKHRLAAEWIESLGRAVDHAEMLAHHYGAAFELARAARVDTSVLEVPARRAFADAGDRALALNAYDAAIRLYEQALALWPEADPDRAELLLRRARAVLVGVDRTRTDLFDEARDALLAAGRREAAAEAETLGAVAVHSAGRGSDAVERARSAVELLGRSQPTRTTTYVVANLARLLTVASLEHEQAIETATGALACARQLGLPELEAHALNTLGIALVATGDLDGIAQLEESVRIALDHAGPLEIARIYNNLIAGYVRSGRLKEATTIAETLLDFQQRVGMPSQTQEIFVAMHEFTLGRWNDALTRIDSARRTRRASTHLPYGAHGAIAQMLLARDDLPGAVAECERALDLFRARGRDPDSRLGLQSFLALRGLIALAQDERAVADDLADELLAMDVDARSTYPMSMFLIALLLSDLGRKDRAAFMDAVGERPQPWVRVAIAISEGRFGEAVDRLADMGAQTFEAAVRLRYAAQLVSWGRRAEADVQLEQALAFYRSVGATRYIREGETLLAVTA